MKVKSIVKWKDSLDFRMSHFAALDQMILLLKFKILRAPRPGRLHGAKICFLTSIQDASFIRDYSLCIGHIKAYEMIFTPWDKTQSFLKQNEPF